MAKELDTTLNRATRLQLADSEARGVSQFNSTMLTLSNPDVWRILTQRSILRWMATQMGSNTGVTRLVESLLILMSNLCHKFKIGGRELELVNLYMCELYICEVTMRSGGQVKLYSVNNSICNIICR